MTFKEMGIDAYPLCWPEGWKRSATRKRSKFKAAFGFARDSLFRELKLLGVRDYNVIISSNIPLRRDGIPYAGQSNPKDPGIAVYFRLKDKPMVLACDQYLDATDNLYAITKTVEALRGIERWGASDMMERSFTGFQALPPAQSQKWWKILNVKESSTLDEVKTSYRDLARVYHPDKMGGSTEMMAKINHAYEEACQALQR
jgi:hypothetical protein